MKTNPAPINIHTAARAEYDRRFAKAQKIEAAGDLTHEITDQVHNWQRIAWLLDHAGRVDGEQINIDQDDLTTMAAEAKQCRDIWFAKCEANPGDQTINQRARGLAAIARNLECRAAALKEANEIGRRRGALARSKAAA